MLSIFTNVMKPVRDTNSKPGLLWYYVYIMRNGRCFQTHSLFFQPIFRYREISRLLLKPLLTALNLPLGTTSLFIVRLCMF